MKDINSESASRAESTSITLRNNPKKINLLIDLMNDQSHTPVLAMSELVSAFDVVFSPDEVEFLLRMGGGKMTLKEIQKKVKFPKRKFNKIFKNIIEIGAIIELEKEENEQLYHIMSIIPGWCELYMHRGLDTPERRLFAERLGDFYRALEDYGDREFLDNMIRDLGPNHSIYSMVPSKEKTIEVGKTIVPDVSKVFPTKTVVEIFEKLDENDAIALSHCFCRQINLLEGDPCRLDIAPESCIYLGPHAEHLLKYNFSRRITKEEAIKLVEEFQNQGAVHLVGKTAPLKNIEDKFEADNICSCCWDCCGLFGNYNRGNMPFILKSYYMAKISEKSCTGCGQCIEFCPLQAISLNKKGIAKISEKRCCGCGQCSSKCPENAITMITDEREVFLPMQEKSKARIPNVRKKPAEKPLTKKELEKFNVSKEEVFKVMDELHEKFLIEKNIAVFKGWNKTMLFHFTDIEEYWYMKVVDGRPESKKEGFVKNAEIIYTMSTGVFVRVMRGEMNATNALRKKLIKVKASVRDLIKLMKLS